MEKDYIGSIKSEIAKVDDNVSVNADILDMDRLSISSPAKYIATYNKPRDWVLDQDEARVLQVLRDVATPEKASKVGSVAYGAGEALRRTSQLPGRIAQDMVGKDAWVFPNANPESARRAYNNMLKLSVQAEQNRADYVAEHGVDTDVYGFTSSALEAVRDMFLAGGVGKAIGGIAKTGSLVYAGERVLPGATGVAERFATMQGRKAASKAIKASIFASALANEMPDRSVKQAAEYMDKTGDYDLKYYDPTADMGINTAVSLANAWIESSLGIEGVVPDMLFGTRKASRWTTDFIKGYLGERSEEFIQNIFDQGGDVLSGYRQNIDVAEAFKESAPAGILGGVFRSGASAGMYYLNRRRMIRQLEDAGVNKKLATSFVDKYLENGIDKTLNNVSAANELTMRSGDAFDKMKAGIKSMLELQGWATKMVDPNTGTQLNIDEYVDLTVNTQLINTAVKEAIRSGITIDEFLDVAEFVSIDNFVTLRPLGSVEEIQTKIDAQDAIIKRQQELKKTGAGDDTVLREAKIKKAILQKARLNKIATNEIQRVNVETAKTPETIKEIENATKDVEILNNSETPTDFNNKLGDLTTEQKIKRFGNAVIKKIFGNDKLGFDSVITLPEYANAKTALINSAERILDYAKKHRSYGIYTDLRNALNLMQTVNRENFTEFASTPALDGNDVIAQNAFLYHFLFSDTDTISAFIDSYIQRAEASIGSKTKLSKKDLVGQALKATDDLMQIRAESAGIERKSIYKEDGSFADENVAAMFVSYQNQFAGNNQNSLLQEQFDLADDRNLVATHAIKLDGMKQALRVGGFAMPSLAIKKDLDNIYGEIIFVAPADMAKPSRTTKVYDRDAWTPMINFIEYKSKDGFYDRVKEILTLRGIDPKSASSFVYNIEEKMKEGVAEWNTTAIELFGIEKGYIERGEEDEMRSLINQNADIRDEYNKWYEEFIIPNMSTRIFRGFTNLGNRRYVPATLENIVKELKTQPEHRDFSWNDTYFFHDVARELVSRFKTVKEIKRASSRLIDNTKVVDKINELSSEYYTLAEELKIDESSHNPEILLSLALIEGKGSTAEKLETVGLKSDKDSVKKVDTIVKKIKELPTQYFEGKVRRAVRFNEFSAVFVPEGRKYDEVASRLSDQDANVIRYDSSYDLDNKFAQLVQEKQNILFQGKQANGFFDPELNVILLGKNWNTMTLPHEFAHYWLNTLFNVYKRVQAGELQASSDWIAEKKDMFAMLGIDENQQALTTGQQEKFARMTEAYLTGIGVGKEMNQTFKDYFAWVPEKYKSILQLGYLDDQGKIQYPFLDQKAVDFFNRWYENASLPSLPTSPERQRFMNVATSDGSVEKVSIKEMNDREKEFAQDAQEQNNTDQRLYTTLDENMPADIKPVADAQKVVIGERSNFLKESESEQKKATEEPKRRWYERKSRETESQLAQEYIEKNPEHAREVIFGDPELIPNDTGIDRATLINAYMAINNITPQSPEWATLHTNIAVNQSLAGTQLALSNDKSYGTYLDALREIEDVLELKAATNYAGSKQGARERFNTDIQRFLNRELPAIFATAPNSKERETALRVMFEKARTTFSGNTTGSFLNQVDLEYAKAQKGKTEAFMRWAINQIKKDAGAKLSTDQQAKLLQISAKAQQALLDLDNRDSAKAVAAAQELRNWQLEKQKMMGVSPQKFSLFGDWAPRAMLASFNTLVVANLPSTAINTAVVNATKTGLFGKNNVSQGLIDAEIKRIKEIYGATGMNLAQMEKPTSPSLLHGEKYSTSGQKWYDPYVILGKEDNFFRVPTFVNTLAQIASTDAKASGRNADDVFKEYLSLNNQTDEAKLARKQALAVANMAVFTQNGALASCLNHIRSELNKLSRVTFGLDPKGFGLGNLIAPFLTTGANIAEMGIRGSLAPLTTITTMVNSWRTGKSLDPMKKLALRMDWTYFTVSAIAMALLSALTSDDDEFYTDPYRTGRKYNPSKPYDSINLGGVWLDLDFFGPFAIPIRTSAKVIQAWKKDNGIFEGLGKGYAESAKSVLGDIPLAESIINNQVNWAVKKPGSWASSYVYNQANKLIPAQVKPVSRAISRANDWVFEPFEGTTVGRKFNRNYGFDGAELTSQDLIELFTIKLQLDEELNQKID